MTIDTLGIGLQLRRSEKKRKIPHKIIRTAIQRAPRSKIDNPNRAKKHNWLTLIMTFIDLSYPIVVRRFCGGSWYFSVFVLLSALLGVIHELPPNEHCAR